MAAFKDKQLTPSFKLSDLIRTDTGLENLPSAAIITKLTNLAKTLENIKTTIGDFAINSVFRTQAVQDKLRSYNAQATESSYHTLGIAADIVPTTMKSDAFFRKIANTPAIAASLGEIAVKENALHISLPTADKKSFFMKVIDDIYHPITLKEAQEFVWKFKIPIGSVIMLGILAYLGYKYFQGKVKVKNPTEIELEFLKNGHKQSFRYLSPIVYSTQAAIQDAIGAMDRKFGHVELVRARASRL